MSDTPRLGLPQIAASQAQKHVTHNEALLDLDAFVQTSALDRDLAGPPGSPADGDTYVVAPGATGAWAGQDGALAVSIDGAWRFATPFQGLVVWIVDETLQIIYHAGAWHELATLMALQNIAQLGVNTTADATNKEAVGDTGSLLFQTNFSGRAEVGLAGDDDLSLKVSPDGAGFLDALKFDAATAAATCGDTLRLASFTVAGLPSASARGVGSLAFVSNEAGGAVVAFSDGAVWRRVTDRVVVA